MSNDERHVDVINYVCVKIGYKASLSGIFRYFMP